MQNLMQQFQVYWNIRWLRRLAISAAALLIVLLLIPLAIQYAIGYVLRDQGASEASIQDINLNLFAGSFELTGLNMQVSGNQRAEIAHIFANVEMLELISSRIVIDQLQLKGIKAEITRDQDGNISINGLKVVDNKAPASTDEPPAEEQAKPLAFAVNQLSLQQIEAIYQEPDLKQNLTINELELKNIKSWDPSSISTLALDITLNQSPIKLSAELNLFNKTRTFKGETTIQSIAFEPFAKFYRDYLSDLKGTISITSQFDIALSDQLTGRIDNNVEISNLDLQYQHIHQLNKMISWKGNTELVANSQPVIQGNLHIEESKTIDSKYNYRPAAFASLDMKGVLVNPDVISVAKFNLINLNLANLDKSHQLLELDALTIDAISFEPQQKSLAIQQIALSKPLLQVTLNKQKKLQQLEPVLTTVEGFSAATAETKAPAASTEADQAFRLKVAKLILLEPGQLNFTDLSVSPNYATTLHFNKIDIDNISSDESANFKLALKQGDHTTIDIDGSGLLLDPSAQIALNATIKQLDLPPVTSYTSAAMGYGMKSGVIDSDINVKIDKRIIDSVIDLKIDSIEVVETNAKTAEQVTSASGMSIDLAISTLKDDDNIIDLKLPVKGSLDQPDFDLSKVINKALGMAMQSASLSYLKYALQPFGSLVSLFNLAKAAAEHITLPPVSFNTNSVEFADNQQQLLGKVLKVLTERPALKIKACGISSLADYDAIKEELMIAEIERLKQQQKAENKKIDPGKPREEIVIAEELIQQKMKDLADNRSARVKNYFLEKGNLKSNRILNCLSSSNMDEKSQASVELEI